MSVLAEFARHARRAPDRPALVLPESVTYGALLARAEALAGGLRDAGLDPGARVLLAAPVSVDFFAMAIAVVGSGMQLVLVDGRMDRRRLLGALRSARPDAVVSPAEALRRWPLIPPLWRARRWDVEDLPTGRPAPLGGGADDAVAMLSFTSGSTGRAKGVVRTHGILLAQHRALARHLPLRPGDVDLTCFPAVVLHNLACGATTVLPPGDLREPGRIDPVAAAETMRRHRVTTVSAGPAFAEALATQGPMAGVRRIVVGGGPVPRALCRKVVAAFPGAEALVVYGSTEAEPIAHVAMEDVLGALGAGLLVGAPVAEADVALVRLPPRLARAVPAGWTRAQETAVGEVVVRGCGVSRTYAGDPEAVIINKVRESDGSVWHRTGDVARRDADGRLWLLGRVSDVVHHAGRDVHPLALEADLASVPGVRRAALVAHRGAPDGEVAVVAADPDATRHVRDHLRDAGLPDLPVRVVEAIPTDARHNSKVDRPALRQLLA